MIFMHNDIESHKRNNLIQGYDTDMGFDIRSGEDVLILPGRGVVIETGLHVYIPPLLGGVVQGRSSLSINHNVEAGNAGVIDSGYTGTVKIKLYNHDMNNPFEVKTGDRVAQMVFHVRPDGLFDMLRESFYQEHMGWMADVLDFTIQEKDISEWPKTERARNGFGSTGVR